MTTDFILIISHTFVNIMLLMVKSKDTTALIAIFHIMVRLVKLVVGVHQLIMWILMTIRDVDLIYTRERFLRKNLIYELEMKFVSKINTMSKRKVYMNIFTLVGSTMKPFGFVVVWVHPVVTVIMPNMIMPNDPLILVTIH